MSDVRLRHVAQINPSTPEFDLRTDDEDVTFLPLEAVWSGTKLDVSQTRPKREVSNGYTRFRENDVLVPKITPTFEADRSTIARGLLGEIGAGTTELHVIRPGSDLEVRYANYLLSSKPFLRGGKAEMKGVAGQQRVPDEWLRDFRVPVTEVTQQRAIADFLDAETVRIDALIAKKREVLRLLGERRRSYLLKLLASPGTRLREVEWLGHVPESWPLVQIGVLGDFYAGTTFPHNYQGQTEGDLPFIKVGDLWSDEAGTVIDNANNWITHFDANALGGRVVPAGSVLYARVGEALRLNPRRLTSRPALVDDNVRAVHFRHGDGGYWSELLTLLDLLQLANPGPVPSVSEGQVASVRVPLAPHDEQMRIAYAMAREREVRSDVSALIADQLDRLLEHRQALITAAVTGEIGVEGLRRGRSQTVG